MSMSATFEVAPRGEHEIVLTRQFAAPRAKVWEAMTKPALLRQWLFGPPGWAMVECSGEPRVGGSFRWAWRHDDGMEMAMGGEYLEVQAPARMVRTERFEGCPAQTTDVVGTLELAETDARTRMVLTLRYPNAQARDAALASGMKEGMTAGYARLDALISGASA